MEWRGRGVGSVGLWSRGVLESWSLGVMEFWVIEWRNFGVRSGGVEENGGRGEGSREVKGVERGSNE